MTRAEFEGRKQEVLRKHRGASLIAEEKVSLADGNVAFEGWHASFVFTQQMAGGTVALRSDLFIFGFIATRWNLEYRFSYPASADVRRDMDDLCAP